MDIVAQASGVIARFLVWQMGSGYCLVETRRIYVIYVTDVRT